MQYAFFLSALAGLAAAAPQLIDIEGVESAPDPVFTVAPITVVSQSVAPAPTASISPITTDVAKRELPHAKRDGNCAKQPVGAGPVPTPDTPAAFSSSADLEALSQNAPTPDGYNVVFTGKDGSLSASRYMGLYTLDSFDTLTCASKCDRAAGCQAFNMYSERDPSLDPNTQNCPNPPSTTNFKCTLWGAPVAVEQANNRGQWRASFQVVITGSNAYNKQTPPPSCDGFTGPTALGGAINAPLDAQKHNTYMGYKYFPFSQTQGYTPSTCAAACDSQTGYNSRHPAADGSFQTCRFFNSYVLSQNAIPQGLYCSLYNQTWAPSYATNYGQYRGSDRFTVSRSYSYSK